MCPDFHRIFTAAAGRTTPTKKDENTRVPSPSTLSSMNARAQEGGSNDEAVASNNKSKASSEYRKVHGEKQESDNEETIVYSKKDKDGFEMVPLDDAGEQ